MSTLHFRYQKTKLHIYVFVMRHFRLRGSNASTMLSEQLPVFVVPYFVSCVKSGLFLAGSLFFADIASLVNKNLDVIFATQSSLTFCRVTKYQT